MLLFLRLVGSTLGVLSFYLGIRRDVSLDNVKRAFPELPAKRISQICRGAYANLGRVFLEFLYLRYASSTTIANGLRINNLQVVTDALNTTNGAILLSGHLTNWEWLALGTGLQIQQPLDVIIKNQKSSFAERFMIQMRTRFGNKMINAGDVRSIYKAIKSGELLAILGDQAAPTESIRVPFFGRDVPTFEGTARMALRTHAPIFFLQPIGVTRSGYDCRFIEILYDDLSDTSEASVVELTRRHTEVLEVAIRERPEFWLWQHKRWKNAG